ncbi:hypothetical protein [Streptomyces albireticuli]|uniref:hypothetical protein n=1 Tax=Streptomyces albireticuli TaxID=1940 RepID=UPI0027E276E0|nr:hypothetical protein [Streptomyces albireticuli]
MGPVSSGDCRAGGMAAAADGPEEPDEEAGVSGEGKGEEEGEGEEEGAEERLGVGGTGAASAGAAGAAPGGGAGIGSPSAGAGRLVPGTQAVPLQYRIYPGMDGSG